MTKSSVDYDAVIVVGGPAGSSAAIHLAMNGASVLLVEQKKFPREKLCGEFISPECLDHFSRLGVADQMLAANGTRLTETLFYARNGRSLSVPSEWFGRDHIAALGLSRAQMDARLLSRAHDVGVEVLEEAHATAPYIENETVTGVKLKRGDFEERTVRALVTIDATGRSRSLARRVEKEGIGNASKQRQNSRLVAFKTHLEGTRGAPGHCEIYVYRGGYGGLNSIENDLSNLCFIAKARDVRRCGGDAERAMHELVRRNRRAAHTLANARSVSPWMAVALDGFGRRTLVPVDGLMAVGDAASFIDPFTGSGMLMALESGELAALSILRFLPGLRTNLEFSGLRNDYRARYDRKFTSRLRVCSALRRAAFMPWLAETMIFTLGASDRTRRKLARATHTPRSKADARAG